MATAAQIEANRRNAQMSTGPKTASGKAKASLNSLKHGERAKVVVPVLPQEDPEGAGREDPPLGRGPAAPGRPRARPGRAGGQDLLGCSTAPSGARPPGWPCGCGRPSSRRTSETVAKVCDLGRKLLYNAGPRILPVSGPPWDDNPAAFLCGLESTAEGCRWLLERWTVLGDCSTRRLWTLGPVPAIDLGKHRDAVDPGPSDGRDRRKRRRRLGRRCPPDAEVTRFTRRSREDAIDAGGRVLSRRKGVIPGGEVGSEADAMFLKMQATERHHEGTEGGERRNQECANEANSGRDKRKSFTTEGTEGTEGRGRRDQEFANEADSGAGGLGTGQGWRRRTRSIRPRVGRRAAGHGTRRGAGAGRAGSAGGPATGRTIPGRKRITARGAVGGSEEGCRGEKKGASEANLEMIKQVMAQRFSDMPAAAGGANEANSPGVVALVRAGNVTGRWRGGKRRGERRDVPRRDGISHR